jgi:hypothetical protein
MIRKLFRTRRRKVAALVITAALISAVAAWAYFSGSGSDSEPVSGGSAPALTLEIGAIAADLYPGAAVDVPLSVSYAGEGNAQVGRIVAGTPLVEGAAGCLASWFSFADVAINQTISSADPAISTTGSLVFEESGTSQDACVDAALTLNLTTAP